MVTLHRQRVDTWGMVPNKEFNFNPFSCTVSPRCGGHSINKAASIPFVVHTVGTVRREMGTNMVGHYIQPVPWTGAYQVQANKADGNNP